MRVSFATETALPLHRAAFGAVGFVFCAVATAVMIWPSAPLPASVRAVIAAIVVTLPANWVTAYLLQEQFSLLRRPSLAVLGAGFWYSAMMSACYLVALPGAPDEPMLYRADEQTSTWLWVIWRFGFLVFIFAFVVLDKLLPVKTTVSRRTVIATRYLLGFGIPILVVLLAYGLEWGHGYLPAVIDQGRFDPWFSLAVGFPALAFHLALVLAFVALTRLKSLTDVAFTFALLAWLLGDTLTLTATARFTLGWYMGLLEYVASCLAVPAAFLIRLNALYVQVDKLNESLAALALLDGMTGLANRRQFDQRLAAEWLAAIRRREWLALLMIDVDRFKMFNDRFGHGAGDECLKSIALAIQNAAKRSLDLAARYGGEEFAVILPATERAGAILVAERILSTIRELAIPHPDGNPVSVSIGLATVRPRIDDQAEALARAADDALYRAKSEGKDRVVAADPIPSPPATEAARP